MFSYSLNDLPVVSIQMLYIPFIIVCIVLYDWLHITRYTGLLYIYEDAVHLDICILLSDLLLRRSYCHIIYMFFKIFGKFLVEYV